MSNTFSLKQVIPTVFLAYKGGPLQQLVRLTVSNQSAGGIPAAVIIRTGNMFNEISLGMVPSGESSHEIFIDEVTHEMDVEFILKSIDAFCSTAGTVSGIASGGVSGDAAADRKIIPWKPPKHWTVHVIQLSHHDPGYTDIPSQVLKDHYRWLDDAVTIAEDLNNFPDDAKFRIVIEQAWSIDHYLNNAPSDRAAKIIELMRLGRFELTALFGNMTTEICGHETLARTLYHAFGIKRKYGIPIVSAEHNDITGISWGLSRVLTDAGIKIFCPGIPLYYSWDKLGLQSFWDEKRIFPHGGPGAFWWEAPTGKKMLFWCNNSGCGGDMHTNLPGLAGRLQKLDGDNYPYSVMRWPVGGGARDNSPYIDGFAHTIKEWNEKWAYPRLICSTNAKFYYDFVRQIPADLPVFRGELAGHDYPVGATSTAQAAAVNRNNHNNLITAEKLATAADLTTDYDYPGELLFDTYKEVFWHDEHAWGYHFPCGPAMHTSEYEKAITAIRASAHIHGITNKAMARIADNIKLEHEGFHLVVFNSASTAKTGSVRAPLREIDNSGSTMVKVPPEEDPVGVGYLRGVVLNDRWHAHPPLDFVDGRFDLVDVATGEKVPFQIIEIDSPDDTVPFAAQRLGLGSGGRRYGFFEIPLGLKRDVCFIARDVPAYGYRTYRLVPNELAPAFDGNVKNDNVKNDNLEDDSVSIENGYYRISVNREIGAITSIYDKSAGRDLVDADCPHRFNMLIVRTPKHDREYIMEEMNVYEKLNGPVCASIEITGSAYGHPAVKQTVSLYTGIKQIHLDTRILKDATPLLDVHLAFPFHASNPGFRYEGSLAAMTPIVDYLPGSYSDTIAVQNWVKMAGGGFNILWSSLDAPIAGFGGLWPGYVSPAHRCVIDESAKHPPLRTEDLDKGWIYSNIFYNNHGTNFSVSQVGDVLFRYVITSCEGDVSDGKAAAFGWQASTPFEQIFTKRPRVGTLPSCGSFVNTGSDEVVLLTCKKAEDEKGYILRLWNMSSDAVTTKVRLNFITNNDLATSYNFKANNNSDVNNNSYANNNCMAIDDVFIVNLAEEDMDMKLAHDEDSFIVILEKNAVVTVYVHCPGFKAANLIKKGNCYE